MANAYVRTSAARLRRVARHAGRGRPHHPCARAVSNAAGPPSPSWRSHHWSAGSGTSRLAINQFQQGYVDEAAVDHFLAGRDVPIVEGRHCTFLYRGEADEAYLAQRILGLPSRLPMRRVAATRLWYVVLKVPQRSRINYQIEVRRGEHVERFNDPLNPKLSHSPFGAISVCFTFGYITPEWTAPDPDAPPGELTELLVESHALQRDCQVTLYLPARFSRAASYPLLVVHDGGDFLQYAAAKIVLDNLIHRGEIAPTVTAFLHPKDRLVEYANSPAHARFLTHELLPQLQTEFPLVPNRSGRILLGASFGAIAALSTAYAAPRAYGSLVLMSGRLCRQMQERTMAVGLCLIRLCSSSTATVTDPAALRNGFSSVAGYMSR